MINENDSFANIRKVHSDELDELTNLDLYSIVQVDDNYDKLYVLLDDIEGNKFWSPTINTNKNEILNIHNLYKRGQRLFKQKARSSDELIELREAMVAVSVLGNFLNWQEEEYSNYIDNVVVQFAYKLICKDKNINDSLEYISHNYNKEFEDYCTLSGMYVKSFIELTSSARQSAESVKSERNKQ